VDCADRRLVRSFHYPARQTAEKTRIIPRNPSHE
jgi:hypothetical protein